LAESEGNGRIIDPPLPVIVDLAALFPPGPTVPGPVPTVNEGGLSLAGYAPGELLAWARSSSGAWVACVRFVVQPEDKQGQIPMLQWMPASSIRPS
jgi:hypothetical protein